MNIEDDFMRIGKRTNKRISIISNGGNATPIPKSWRPIQGSSDMLVVIPDAHMYMRQSPQNNFRYGAEALSHLLDHLEALKSDLESKGKLLRIYQLGDFFEMRFGSLASPGTNATPSEIRMSDPEYDLIINKMDYLRTHLLYGNHDFELRHFPSFRFGAVEGKVYLEHGFAPSPWSENPRNLLWEPAQLGFKVVREIESFFLNLAVCLLRNEPAVTRLLGHNPFPNEPPRYLRALLYNYHFTDLATHARTGAWWRRELKGQYLPTLTRTKSPNQSGKRLVNLSSRITKPA